MLNHTHIYNTSSASEKRLIYDAEKPGVFETTGGGAGELFSVGADLLKLMTSVLKSGVDLVRNGYTYVKNGALYLSEKISDPGKPVSLPEYDELTEYFELKESSSNATVNHVLKLHTCLVFLEFKTHQLAQFYRPAVEELNSVETRLKSISEQRYRTKKRRGELEDLIQKGDDAIKNGIFIKGSNREVELRTELQGYKSELQFLNSSISTVVSWTLPQTVGTEFPPDSGQRMERFFPDRNQKVRVDLNQLYSFLKGYVKQYNLDQYLDEMKKLAYHRDKLLSQSIPPNYHPRVREWMDQITNKGDTCKNSVSLDSFKHLGEPKPLSYLERQEPTPEQVRGDEEKPQIKERLRDLRKFLE